MSFWSETDGGRVADDIISCMYHYVTANFEPLEAGTQRTLVIWSDRCKGQNNNYPTVLAYLTLVYKRYCVSL